MSNDKEGPKTARLAQLVAFFQDPNFVPGELPRLQDNGETLTILPTTYDPIVEDLMRIVYEDGWIRPGFDWPAWLRTAEARVLRNQPGAIEHASMEQLRSLLTVMVRQERFADGALLSLIKSGLVRRVLERVAVLHRYSQ